MFITYDQIYNASFHQKLESIKYNSVLAILGAIWGTSTEKLNHELGLEALENESSKKKTVLFFFLIFRSQCPKYPFNIITVSVSTCNTKNTNNIPLFKVKQSFCQFLFSFCEWHKLYLTIQNSESYNIFKESILKFIHLSKSGTFNCKNPKRVNH